MEEVKSVAFVHTMPGLAMGSVVLRACGHVDTDLRKRWLGEPRSAGAVKCQGPYQQCFIIESARIGLQG